MLFGPLRSHTLKVLTEWPGNLGQLLGKSLQVGTSVRRAWPGCKKAMSLARDSEPTVMTHPTSGPTQKPFLWRQQGVRGGRALRSQLGSHCGCHTALCSLGFGGSQVPLWLPRKAAPLAAADPRERISLTVSSMHNPSLPGQPRPGRRSVTDRGGPKWTWRFKRETGAQLTGARLQEARRL